MLHKGVGADAPVRQKAGTWRPKKAYIMKTSAMMTIGQPMTRRAASNTKTTMMTPTMKSA
jgi:hypothetical protein